MDRSIKTCVIRGLATAAAIALISGCEHSPSTANNSQTPTYKTACANNPYLMKYDCSLSRIQKAAENGDADAQYALGYMYYYGIGTVKDQQTAALWIERSAAAGQPLAKKAWTLINTGAMFNDLNGAAAGTERQSSEQSSIIVRQQPTNVSELNAAVHKEPITTYLPAYNAGRPENQPSSEIPQLMKQQYPGQTGVTTTPSSPTSPISSANQPTLGSANESREYTMQLMASQQLGDVKNFIAKHHLVNNAHYYSTERNGRPWYILTYGNYQTQDQAVQALRELPADLKSYHPWVKSFASVEKEAQPQKAIG